MTAAVVKYGVGERGERPWGEWLVVDTGAGFAVKRILVRPGGRLSLQKHRHRQEHWVVVAGTAQVTLDAAVLEVPAGASIHIPLGAVHRVQNTGEHDLVFIEVQSGAVLDENDIERLEDDYGRS